MLRLLLLLALTACPSSGDETGSPDPGCADADGDGALDAACGGADCDDGDDGVFPGAPERCNGVDDDCDGEVLWEADGECADCEAAGWFADLVAAEPADRAGVVLDSLERVRCDYSTATRQMFLQLDIDAGRVTCVYTGEQVGVSQDKPDPTVMNTEHTWPQSEGAGTEPAKCDLHHLYPSMSDANQARRNLPFGEVDGDVRWSEGGSKASATHFEPRDVHKGDAARSMVYFALRYGYALSDDQRALFLRWSDAHPPTEADVARSTTIARWQGSKNPFVVCPMAAEDLAR